jgi:WD40 repeat protein
LLRSTLIDPPCGVPCSLGWNEAINETWIANTEKERADRNAEQADAATKQAQGERDAARIQLLAIQARRAAHEATSPDGIERAGALALESIELARSRSQPVEADAVEVVTGLLSLPLMVFSQGSPVSHVVVLADGRLASGSIDGTIKLWPKDGRGEPVVLSQGSAVEALAALPDGRLASGSGDGTIKLWPKDGRGEPTVLSQGGLVGLLAALPDGRLASASGAVSSPGCVHSDTAVISRNTPSKRDK